LWPYDRAVSAPAASLLFVGSLVTTLAAAGLFASRLDHVGLHLGLPEAVLGLLTALAADAPELSSAVVALASGAHGVGVGVVIGSNLFNLASMIGVSALVGGAVVLARAALVVEGTAALAVTLIAGALIAGVLPAAAAVLLIVAVLVPYVLLLTARRPSHSHLLADVQRDLGERHREERPESVRGAVLLMVPAVAAIVLGSVGMVTSALDLGDRIGISRAVLGTVVLAVLTSLPNAFTGIRLGLSGRGAALVSETLNSNTINLFGGLAVPALFVGLGAFHGVVRFDLAWLVAATVVVVALLACRRGVGRTGGALIVLLYLVFLAVQVGRG
jgi:cation:H+ antiporter